MRKSIAAATLAASILGGGAFGAALGVPGLASAETAPADDTAADRASWVDDALAGLVSDGTINQSQADAVEAALKAARPDHRPGKPHHWGHPHLDAAAEALDMTPEELRTELQEGKTLATIAGEQGVAVDVLVDALVAEHAERLDQAVADGDLTQAEADERKAEVEEKVTAMVNGEGPARTGRGRLGFGEVDRAERAGPAGRAA